MVDHAYHGDRANHPSCHKLYGNSTVISPVARFTLFSNRCVFDSGTRFYLMNGLNLCRACTKVVVRLDQLVYGP